MQRTNDANGLRQYLAEKRKEAQLAEEVEEDDLKRQGKKKLIRPRGKIFFCF